MQYEVISRFFDRERGVYVDVGAPCPRLSRRTTDRLLRARCIAQAEPEPREPKGGRGKTPVVPPPAAPDAPPPAGD
jgi:hypothetical protein